MKKITMLAAVLCLTIGTSGAHTLDEIGQKVTSAFDQGSGTFTEVAYDALYEAHGMIVETLAEDPGEVNILEALSTLDVLVMYNLGCLSALEGNTEEAFEWLQGSVDAGYNDPDWMEQDQDLSSLHEDSRFRSLLDAAAENCCGTEDDCCRGCNEDCH